MHPGNIKLSVFDRVPWGTNSPPDDTIEDWEDLIDLLGDVKTVDNAKGKDGKHFVCGHCVGGRSDANMASLDVVVIDGDTAQGYDTGGCCPANLVHKAMVDADICHIIHTSFQNNPAANFFRWRMVVPVKGLNPNNFVQAGHEIIAILHKRGLLVDFAKEDGAMSQAWYTPRCLIQNEDDFYVDYHTTKRYEITGEDVNLYIKAKQTKGSKSEAKPMVTTSAFDLLASGSAHTAIMSLAGWYVRTTDWTNSQILAHLIPIMGLCSDPVKVERELENDAYRIRSKIEHCRKESGKNVGEYGWQDSILSASEYPNLDFPEPIYLIDKLITTGLTLVGAAPKSGKSTMMIDFCLGITTGTEALGYQKCKKASVIYMSLEDQHRLVKKRIGLQRGEYPDNLHILERGVPQLGDDFLKMLEEMYTTYENLGCIIIDTLAKVSTERKNNQTGYDHAYKMLGAIRQWALDHEIALIIITHTSKSTGTVLENKFDKMLGSVGLQGVADVLMLLERFDGGNPTTSEDDKDGLLTIKGKDTINGMFQLFFDNEAEMYIMGKEIAESENPGGATNTLLIIDLLKKSQWAMTVEEISENLKIKKAVCKVTLSRLKKRDKVKNDKGKWWVGEVEEKQLTNVWD